MSTHQDELDRIYRAYTEEEGFERTLLGYKIRAVLDEVRGESALDVGCGVGFVSKALSARVTRVVGIDGSPAKVSRARELNAAPNVEFVCSLFESWSPAAPFDTIVSTNVLEHVDDARAFLARCWTLLAPGGRVVVTVPNALGLHKRIGKAMGLIADFYDLTPADHAKGHKRIYDRARLEADVRSAGFTIARFTGILLKPLSHAQMLSWDRKIVDALFAVGQEIPDWCSSLLIVGERSEGALARD